MDPTEFRTKLVAALLPKDQACGVCNGRGLFGEGYAEQYEMKTCRFCTHGRVPTERDTQLCMTADEIADVVSGILVGAPLNPLDTNLP